MAHSLNPAKFTLILDDAMAARAATVDCCLEEVRTAHMAYHVKNDESLEMHVALSNYKFEEYTISKIYAMRMKSFDVLEGWMQDLFLQLIDITGYVVVPPCVAFSVQYHYTKAVEEIDACMRISLADLENLEMPSVAMEVERTHDMYRQSVVRMIPDFALPVELFCEKHSIPLSLDLAALVVANTAAPRVWSMVEQSRAAFDLVWRRTMAENQSTTIMQETKLRVVEVGLLALRKAASVSTYRRSIMSIVIKSQDRQFSELKKFVDGVCEDHGVFAAGTGSHIHFFVENELATATKSVDNMVVCKATMDAWANEMIEIDDKKASEGVQSPWLDITRTVSGDQIFHVIVNESVASGTALFKENFTKAAMDFGLRDAKFLKKYLPNMTWNIWSPETVRVMSSRYFPKPDSSATVLVGAEMRRSTKRLAAFARTMEFENEVVKSARH